MKKLVKIILILVLVLLFGGGVYGIYRYYDRPAEPIPQPPIDDDMDIDERNVIDREILFQLSPGVNLAGAEFGLDDDWYEHNYPTESIAYFADKGFKLVRLPVSWERLTPTLGGEIDPVELSMLNAFMDEARKHDMYVILDLHNYLRYNDSLIGDGVVEDIHLMRIWTDLASLYADDNNVIAYGIMNEPNSSKGRWPEIAQQVVDAIRLVDKDKIILVSGDEWAGSWKWEQFNPDLKINDPSDLIVYEAHSYFDSTYEGKYLCSFDACNISVDVGEESIRSFVRWLEANDAYGFIGEYGVPADDERWIRVVDNFLNVLEEKKIGSTIWAGGPDWGDYILSIEPTLDEEGNIVDKPHMEVLQKYLKELPSSELD